MAGYRWVMLAAILALASYVYDVLTNRTYVNNKLDSVYDYVIVGAGTAGSVVANRLSEDSSTHVLVLEAGGEETKNPKINVPLMAMSLLDTELDWKYTSIPQKHACKSLLNQQIKLSAGKVLGGSSSINVLMYERGSQSDFDKWAAGGCDGWSYEEVLPYFIKSEANRNEDFIASGYHGDSGPLVVSDIRVTSLPDAFRQAGRELGYRVGDTNGESKDGFSYLQATISRGQRMGTAKAFLRPAMKRDNLHVATEAHVTKVLLDGRRAVGVEFIRNGTLQQVHARKEVILAAGALTTPQILLLSGIGPKKHLQDNKIPVVADLPVGDNLQDHIWTDAVRYELREPITLTEERASSFWTWFDYVLFGTGYLSSPNAAAGSAFFHSEREPKGSQQHAIQLLLQASLMGSSSRDTLDHVRKVSNMDPKVFDALNSGLYNKDGVTFRLVLLHPYSRGTVRLASKDPMVQPIIDPRYLAEDMDVKILIEAVRLSEKIGKTKMFETLGAKLVQREHPQCLQHSYGSSDYWECYIRHNTFSINHFSGTCKMGAKGDPTAVVDPQLRVQGVEGLRVVDASVMPELTSGSPYATVIMIAEKASDLIRRMVTVPPANVSRIREDSQGKL